jgi:hypothetical protein
LKFIKKREKNAEINNSSKINGTKTFGKFPAFLAQKNAQNKTSRNSKSPITYTD